MQSKCLCHLIKKSTNTHTHNRESRMYEEKILYGSWHRVNHPNYYYYYYYYHVKLICVFQIKIVIGACCVSVCYWAIFRLYHTCSPTDIQTIYTGWQCLQFVIKICRHQHVLNATFISTHWMCTWIFFYGIKMLYKWVDNSILCQHIPFKMNLHLWKHTGKRIT